MAEETCLYENKGHDEDKIGKSMKPALTAPATLRQRPFATFGTNLYTKAGKLLEKKIYRKLNSFFRDNCEGKYNSGCFSVLNFVSNVPPPIHQCAQINRALVSGIEMVLSINIIDEYLEHAQETILINFCTSCLSLPNSFEPCFGGRRRKTQCPSEMHKVLAVNPKHRIDWRKIAATYFGRHHS